VSDELTYLVEHPDAPDAAARIDALAGIPEQIVRFLAERLERGIPVREPMLEVLIRRHYREYELHDLRTAAVDGRAVAPADYPLDGRPTHLVTTLAQFSELVPGSAFTAAIDAQLDAATPGHECVIDLYLSWPEMPDAAADASLALQQTLAQLP